MRAVVIGGGVIGLCCARSLRQAGFEVTLLERDAPAQESCSIGNAGMVVPSHVVPLASPGNLRLGMRMLLRQTAPFHLRIRPDRGLARWLWLFLRSASVRHVLRCAPVLSALHGASRAEFEELEQTLPGGIGLQTNGLLMLCATEHGLEEENEAAVLARSFGVPAEVLSEDAARVLDSRLTLRCRGGVYYPRDCHLSPGLLMRRLREDAAGRQVDLRWSTPALNWCLANGRPCAVRTPAGEVAGDIFVVSAGLWTRDLLRPLGVDLPLAAGKGYSVTLPRVERPPSLCAILTEARVAVTPMEEGMRFAGTMELGAEDLSTVGRRPKAMVRSIAHYLPDYPAAVLNTLPVWAGLRPCSPDGMPYLGALQGQPNVLVAAGHAMMGVSLAPITGRIIAELAAGVPPAISLERMVPDRFTR